MAPVTNGHGVKSTIVTEILIDALLALFTVFFAGSLDLVFMDNAEEKKIKKYEISEIYWRELTELIEIASINLYGSKEVTGKSLDTHFQKYSDKLLEVEKSGFRTSVQLIFFDQKLMGKLRQNVVNHMLGSDLIGNKHCVGAYLLAIEWLIVPSPDRDNRYNSSRSWPGILLGKFDEMVGKIECQNARAYLKNATIRHLGQAPDAGISSEGPRITSTPATDESGMRRAANLLSSRASDLYRCLDHLVKPASAGTSEIVRSNVQGLFDDLDRLIAAVRASSERTEGATISRMKRDVEDGVKHIIYVLSREAEIVAANHHWLHPDRLIVGIVFFLFVRWATRIIVTTSAMNRYGVQYVTNGATRFYAWLVSTLQAQPVQRPARALAIVLVVGAPLTVLFYLIFR